MEEYGSAVAASKYAANEIAELINSNNKNGKNTVLGLATGSTPIPGI